MIYDVVLRTYLENQKFSTFYTDYHQLPSFLFKMFHIYHFDNKQCVRVALGIENINNNVYFRDNGFPGCCVG